MLTFIIIIFGPISLPRTVAQGFCCALNSPDRGHATYFLTAKDGLNTRPTIELLRERYGKLPPVRDAIYFERNPCASVLDGSRARDRLGFEPKINWRELVAARDGAKRKIG